MTEEYKCKDCKWLTGKKNIRGIECMNPVLQEKWNGAKNLWMGELRKDTARYKQRNAPACKKFEAKESEDRVISRYIDADAIQIPSTYVDMFENCRNCKLLDEEQVREIIDSAPSIDIVRCRECKYFEPKEDWCYWRDEMITADDFCSYGEREGE